MKTVYPLQTKFAGGIKKYEFMAQKKLKAIHSKQNGGRKREHLSTSEKMTNSAKINNPRTKWTKSTQSEKTYINARKVNKIYRRRLEVNKRKYWQQNDEKRRSITTKNDEF